MIDPVRRIHSLLDRLGRRERRLLSGRALLRGVAAAVAAWLGVVAAVNAGWARPETGWLWLGAIGGAGLIAMLPPILAWPTSRDRRRQAARVEAHAPDLRGELLTVVDRTAKRPEWLYDAESPRLQSTPSHTAL